MLQHLLNSLIPVMNDIVAVLLVTLVGAMFELVRRYTGISIEARHREALQSALANAARLMLNQALGPDAAIEYVRASVPDALKALKVDSGNRIIQLLHPHVLAQTSIADGPTADRAKSFSDAVVREAAR